MVANPQARIYLDWAATAPLCNEASDAMAPFMVPGLANAALGSNANSLHSEGRAAFAALEQARSDFASCIGARSDEVYFTSGATESDNWALYGLVQAELDKRRKEGRPAQEPRILVSSIEHEAVAQAARRLAHEGISVDWVSPDASGRVPLNAVEAMLGPNTLVASIMLANNEVGSIQPVSRIAELAHANGALMHTDAAQALGKLPLDCHALGVDAASFSGHKVCGPKGVGALFVRNKVAIAPYLSGGGQEHGLRSGTQNVAGIVGMAAAAKAICHDPAILEEESSRQRALRDELYSGLLSFEGVHASVPCESGSRDYLCNVVNVCVDGFESETLILRFDMLGFAVSGGSACSSGSLEPSHVLMQLGLPRDRALGALRISIGRYTRPGDVKEFLDAFEKVVTWGAPT